MYKYTSLTLLIVLITFSHHAVCEPKDQEKGPVTQIAEGYSVVNAIISNPEIGEKLREDRLVVNGLTRQEIRQGVTEFVLYVSTRPMMNPSRAKHGLVTIIEDERPTYADGPIDYTFSISIKGRNKTNSEP